MIIRTLNPADRKCRPSCQIKKLLFYASVMDENSTPPPSRVCAYMLIHGYVGYLIHFMECGVWYAGLLWMGSFVR
ncbi:hypothetical protein BDV28DRAFT_141948 [Aspergillus coremiiformis]|uniref:Uncharacterized protein n=1 Tax=Aspergillus coremiiformis TaxID=138285 RepID=A0A5N6YWR8_9EURO|nr:hypothetical protein BDV28DRAFT_141948 [Aspergillus coremiiformis]